MRHIKVVKPDGSLILKKQGSELDILELATCIKHDRIDYQGDIVYIHVKLK